MSRAEPPRPLADAAGRIGLIAGSGALPQAVARTLLAQGADPFVIVIDGEVEAPAAFSGTDHTLMTVEEVGLLVPRLRKAGVRRLVMAGGIARRPRLRAIRWAFSTLKLIPRVAAALTRGDDGLLRGIVSVLEAEGIAVVGAHEIVPELLAPEGLLTQAAPTSADWRDIDAAAEAALAIGMLDIGQAAVAVGGRVIALEGIEGTEGLLERTATLRGHGRIAGRKRGVLVKRCKPQQEMRADLPAIGPDTIRQIRDAGLVGIGVDANRSFILDFERTIAAADENGIFIVGLNSGKSG